MVVDMDAGYAWQVWERITGLGELTFGQIAMTALGFALIWLGLKKRGESLALIALGLGAILANLQGFWFGQGALYGGPLELILHYGLYTGFLPMLALAGMGAWVDFGALARTPSGVLLGAAAQAGIFFTLIGAVALAQGAGIALDLKAAAAVSLLAAANGPIALFAAAHLAPRLVGTIALATYVTIACLPWLLMPLLGMMTRSSERKIRMNPVADEAVGHVRGLVIPLGALLCVRLLLPAATPLMGALALGALARAWAGDAPLMRRARGGAIHLATLLLGLAAGSCLTPELFFLPATLAIFLLAMTATTVGCTSAVLCAKLLNRFHGASAPVNPLIAAAAFGTQAFGTRFTELVALREDGQNSLAPHAAGVAVGGLLGTVAAAGILLSLAPLFN